MSQARGSLGGPQIRRAVGKHRARQMWTDDLKSDAVARNNRVEREPWGAVRRCHPVQWQFPRTRLSKQRAGRRV